MSFMLSCLNTPMVRVSSKLHLKARSWISWSVRSRPSSWRLVGISTERKKFSIASIPARAVSLKSVPQGISNTFVANWAKRSGFTS